MKNSSVIKTRSPHISDIQPLVEWCVFHPSRGRFHYQTSYTDVQHVVWKFEFEEDAILFALTFGERTI